MPSVFIVDGLDGERMYVKNRREALQDARNFSTQCNHVVEVREAVIAQVSFQEIIVRCLNNSGWTKSIKRIAGYRNGLLIKGWEE